MVGTFQEILDSSSGNWVRIKSITDLRVRSFVGSSEAKYSSTELNFGRLRERGWRIVLRPLGSRLFSRLRRPVGRFKTELLGVLRVEPRPTELHRLTFYFYALSLEYLQALSSSI
jgi:hypothetical protein